MTRHAPTIGFPRPRRGGLLLRLRRAHELVGHMLAAFLVTFVAAPCLHTFNHRLDHVHGDARDDAGWAPAAGHSHGHHHTRTPTSPRQAQAMPAGPAASDAPALPAPHGRGALAHFGTVVTPTPLHVVAPPFAPLTTLQPLPAGADRPHTPPRGLPEARGPPR